MPMVFRFYFKHCLIGFGVSAMFIAALLYFNVANLWHLISTSDVGVMALFVFWALNGSVFAGVQTAVAIMLMAEDDRPGGPKGNAPEKALPSGHAQLAKAPVRQTTHPI